MKSKRETRVVINHEFADVDRFINEYVTNVSRSGIFVRSKAPLAPGTLVDLRFTIVMQDMETIEGVGRVVRVSKDPPGMGVTFVELTRASQDLVERLLRWRQARES